MTNDAIYYLEAIETIRRLAADRITRVMGDETIPYSEAQGRVLSEDVFCREDHPSFDNAAMDGFAVNASWLRGASPEHPVELPVISVVAAGSELRITPSGPCAVEIMTGAPIPSPLFDCVVRVEDVTARDGKGGRFVQLIRQHIVGENLRKKGSDLESGTLLAGSGTLLSPVHAMAFASQGLSVVRVRRKLKVAVITTGDEIVAPETKILPPGKIRNSTGPFLLAVMRKYPVEVRHYGVVADKPETFQRELDLVLGDQPDIVLTTGGVSMGKFDFVRPVLENMGANVAFHRCAIRPAKPVLLAEFGRRSNAVLFGLPGNPISVAVGMRFFVDPFIRCSLGMEPEVYPIAVLADAIEKPRGLRCFLRAVFDQDGHVKVLKNQESFRLRPSLQAETWAVVEEGASSLAAGSRIEVASL